MSKAVENVLNNKDAKATDYFELVNTYEYSDLSVHKDGNTVISMSILGETVGTCFLGYVLLGEVITLQQFIGIVGILCGIGIFLYQKDR